MKAMQKVFIMNINVLCKESVFRPFSRL